MMQNSRLKAYSYSRILQLSSPEIPGKTRLSRVLFDIYRDIKDLYLTDRFGNTFVLPSLREPMAFHLFIDGMYEPWTCRFLLRSLFPGNVFVDIGASIGIFSILAAHRVGNTGSVVAIEASSRIHPYLSNNVRINHIKNVRIEKCIVLDTNDKEVLFYDAPIERFGMGSLAPQFNEKVQVISTKRLDSILEAADITHVNVLKVDVEGFEGLVFRGGERLLTSQFAPSIIFEFSSHMENRAKIGKSGDAQNLLRDWGYQIWRLQDFMYKKPPLLEVLTEGSDMLIAKKKSS